MTTVAEKIAALRRTLHRLLTRRLGAHGCRPLEQLRVLAAVEREGIRNQAALAERLLIDAPAVSRLVDRLEADGLLRRCSAEDRRCVRLEVTPAARPELERLHEALAWLDEEVHRHLSERELRTLGQLVEKLHTGLLEEGEPVKEPAPRPARA